MSDPYTIRLKPSRHKRITYRHMILASDDTDVRPKVIKYNISVVIAVIAIFFCALGGFIGLVIFESWRDEVYEQRLIEKEVRIAELEETNASLNMEIASLNNKIEILSNTVNTKTANEAELAETIEAQSVPSEFPLTGSASFKDGSGEEPECVFSVSEGTTVIATASGIVEDVVDDDVYGHTVIIDHNNGYKTYYKNNSESMVKRGDSVSPGTTLFIIGTDNPDMCYQIQREGVFIDPLEILQIKG